MKMPFSAFQDFINLAGISKGWPSAPKAFTWPSNFIVKLNGVEVAYMIYTDDHNIKVVPLNGDEIMIDPEMDHEWELYKLEKLV